MTKGRQLLWIEIVIISEVFEEDMLRYVKKWFEMKLSGEEVYLECDDLRKVLFLIEIV